MKKQKKRTIDSKIYKKDTSVFLKSSKNLVHTNVLAKKAPPALAGSQCRGQRKKKKKQKDYRRTWMETV
ncbi:hypothetical protein [Solibaculum intestinale]|uniref:Uncharacterized protein n=1 Tax=Solibaculum intestinale TaxID=3133165 RepID=A0ABV1E4L6_9FIRM